MLSCFPRSSLGITLEEGIKQDKNFILPLQEGVLIQRRRVLYTPAPEASPQGCRVPMKTGPPGSTVSCSQAV